MRKITVFLMISFVFAENNATYIIEDKNSTKEIHFKPTNPEPITKEKSFLDSIEFKGYLRFRFEKDI
ncbi:MAG: hypothetical protein GX282_03020 [Campylobacteraceae bacterium]|nr:hypothetical protein [Campylobacteraceae bacterium]